MVAEMTSAKAQILETAVQLVRREGPAGVTMRRIANAIGVTPPALYRHFPNREAILRSIADLGYEMFGARMEEPVDAEEPNERILILAERYIDFSQDEPEIFDLMFRGPHSNVRVFPRDYLAGKSRAGNVIINEVKQCLASGAWRDVDVANTVLTIWVQAHGLVVLYQAKRIDGDAQELRRIARASMTLLIRGLVRSEHPADGSREVDHGFPGGIDRRRPEHRPEERSDADRGP